MPIVFRKIKRQRLYELRLLSLYCRNNGARLDDSAVVFESDSALKQLSS